MNPLAHAFLALASAIMQSRATAHFASNHGTRSRLPGEPGGRGYKHMRRYAKRYGNITNKRFV